MNQDKNNNFLLEKLINLSPIVTNNDSKGNNFLHYLSIDGNTFIMKKYLERSLEEGKLNNIINSANNNMETPLLLAVKSDNQDASQLLIDYGANKNLFDKNGNKVRWKEKSQTGGSKKKIIYGNREL